MPIARSAGIPDAELVLVGPPASDTSAGRLPAGVTDLGFVEEIDRVLAGCRGLAAPISVGGGVRVKMLEAASRGLPVVSTVDGLGSIELSLGMTAAVDRADFVQQCRALLLDSEAAADAGARLHAANGERWSARTGQDAVHAWLSA
jgi:glycosyltransferase involved in cell wall biosynthesis